MGEGWGEGRMRGFLNTIRPLPLILALRARIIPSHQGRGNLSFYEGGRHTMEKEDAA